MIQRHLNGSCTRKIKLQQLLCILLLAQYFDFQAGVCKKGGERSEVGRLKYYFNSGRLLPKEKAQIWRFVRAYFSVIWVTSCELRVTSYQLRVKSLKTRVKIKQCEFRSTSLQVQMQCSSSNSRVTTSSNLRITSLNPRVTSLNPRVTSSNK